MRVPSAPRRIAVGVVHLELGVGAPPSRPAISTGLEIVLDRRLTGRTDRVGRHQHVRDQASRSAMRAGRSRSSLASRSATAPPRGARPLRVGDRGGPGSDPRGSVRDTVTDENERLGHVASIMRAPVCRLERLARRGNADASAGWPWSGSSPHDLDRLGHLVDADLAMWPKRRIFPVHLPWPPAMIRPRERICALNGPHSMPSGSHAAVTVADRSSWGDEPRAERLEAGRDARRDRCVAPPRPLAALLAQRWTPTRSP